MALDRPDLPLLKLAEYISDWLRDYCEKSGTNGFVVGVSGGVDSALTSTLAAHTGLPVYTALLPIHQTTSEHDRGLLHQTWLKENFSDQVTNIEIDLSATFDTLVAALPSETYDVKVLANARSRLRMSTLYTIAGQKNLLVAGTGNKVEDFGVGFFTKYGDGGVDLSPIADLSKTQVRLLARALKLLPELSEAVPTDGLYDDDRTDEDQIGATYAELEWAMDYAEGSPATERQREVLRIYRSFNTANKHKMLPIPVCEVPASLRGALQALVNQGGSA